MISFREMDMDEAVRILEMDASCHIRNAWRRNPTTGEHELTEIDWTDEGLPNGAEWHLDHFRNTIRGGGKAFGCFDGDALVGYATIDSDGFGRESGYVLLDQLYVARLYRNKGIGRKLVGLCAEQARSSGADRMFVCAGSSEDTVAFYRRLGFGPATEMDGHLPEEDPNDMRFELDIEATWRRGDREQGRPAMDPNILVLQGSPRRNGNTAALCAPFIEELRRLGGDVRYVALADLEIGGCLGCYRCQDVQDDYGCVRQDDMQRVVDDILWADCIVYATPIYTWYCPTTMKSVLDRHYGLNKFYGTATGSLWAGKKVALLLTHGYDQEYATLPFATGMRRLCEHSRLQYVGMHSVRDEEDLRSFQTPEARNGAMEFARGIDRAVRQGRPAGEGGNP